MDQVSQVREKIDIVALLSEFIALKKTGANFKAVCPFHNEKTPSFVVSTERQMWHCFGCGKGGDAFTFLMEYEHIEFPEALRDLAKRAGVTLEQQGTWQSGLSSKKDKIFAINTIVGEFYHYILTKHPAGKKALDYLLEERGLSLPLINTFMIGFAPSSGNALVTYLQQKKKYTADDLNEAGISTIRRGRFADFFTNRIMFPLIEHRGDVVGFSGRVFGKTPDDVPKYINTKDTIVYHKGTHFFGLNLAKDSVKENDKAIVVEGEFDVIACFKHGIRNVIAIKGTAFTDQQATLLGRFTKNIALCLDQDNAGQNAIKRSLPILEKKGFNTSVILIPDGKDADESLQVGETPFKMAIKHDVGIYDFLLEKALNAQSPTSVIGKQKIGEDLLPFFAGIQNEIVKEHYLRKLSKALQTSYETMVKELEKQGQKETVQSMPFPVKDKKSRKEKLEFYLLALVFQHPSICTMATAVAEIVTEEMFDIPSHSKIFAYLISYCKQSSTFAPKSFIEMLPKELVDTCNTFFLFPIPPFPSSDAYETEIRKSANDMKVIYLRTRIQSLGKELQEQEKEGNEDSIRSLQDEFTKLTTALKQG